MVHLLPNVQGKRGWMRFVPPFAEKGDACKWFGLNPSKFSVIGFAAKKGRLMQRIRRPLISDIPAGRQRSYAAAFAWRSKNSA